MTTQHQPTVIPLNRLQISKLCQIAEQRKDVEWFRVEESHESGIGPAVVVKFGLRDEQDSKIDITDVSTW